MQQPDTYQQIQDILQIVSAATESILHDYISLRKITFRWVPHFLNEPPKLDRVDCYLAIFKKFDGTDQNVCMTLLLAMKADFTITIRR